MRSYLMAEFSLFALPADVLLQRYNIRVYRSLLCMRGAGERFLL